VIGKAILTTEARRHGGIAKIEEEKLTADLRGSTRIGKQKPLKRRGTLEKEEEKMEERL
jgi:hypothetical protein